MQTSSLTLPFPPGATSWPATPEPRRRLRIPGFRRVADRALHPRALRREKERLKRRARRGRPIALGSTAQPYEPLALAGAPLASLRQLAGLAVTVTTRSSEILEQLDLLVELDQMHAVAVDILIASLEPGSADLEERLQTVSALAAEGLTTRLVVTDLPRSPTSAGAESRIRRLFEAAKRCRAFDVAAIFERGVETEDWSRLLRVLRLELGFPRAVAGRG